MPGKLSIQENPLSTSRAVLSLSADSAPKFGAWCAFTDSFLTELVATQGFDYLCVDQQHGFNANSDLVSQIQAVTAAGTTPFVRVQRNDAGQIGKVLDAGAHGVIIPLVNNADEARQAVEACRYPPKGQRSFGPTRARIALGTSEPRELDRVLCIVMVETKEALEEVEKIAAVDGLDGIYIGPSDLSLALGFSPAEGPETQEYKAAVDRIVSACRAEGIAVGIHCAEGETAARYAKAGFDLVTVLSDWSTLLAGVRAQLQVARSG